MSNMDIIQTEEVTKNMYGRKQNGILLHRQHVHVLDYCNPNRPEPQHNFSSSRVFGPSADRQDYSCQ